MYVQKINGTQKNNFKYSLIFFLGSITLYIFTRFLVVPTFHLEEKYLMIHGLFCIILGWLIEIFFYDY